MPASLIDSAVFRDIFSTEAMRGVFSDENRVQKYLDFEAALARAQARLGIIPKEAAEEISRHCHAAEIDFAKLKTQTERIGYPVLPVVQQLVGACRDGLGEWCHWGATTQDITDSATVLQIREALLLIEGHLVPSLSVSAAVNSLALSLPRNSRDVRVPNSAGAHHGEKRFLNGVRPTSGGIKCIALEQRGRPV
jgi:3-carboxy-cis,cis-muconate cycloisomerase